MVGSSKFSISASQNEKKPHFKRQMTITESFKIIKNKTIKYSKPYLLNPLIYEVLDSDSDSGQESSVKFKNQSLILPESCNNNNYINLDETSNILDLSIHRSEISTKKIKIDSNLSKDKENCEEYSSYSETEQSFKNYSPTNVEKIKNLKSKDGKQLQYGKLKEFENLINMVLSHMHFKCLLNAEEKRILYKFNSMEDDLKYVIMKLYIYKKCWYNIFKFCTKAAIQIEDEQKILKIFHSLAENNFVDTNYTESTDLLKLLNELEVKQIKEIMHKLRIKANKAIKKEELINIIYRKTRQQLSVFSTQTLQDKVIEQVRAKLGYAIKIRDDVYHTLNTAYNLTTFTYSEFLNIQTYFWYITDLKVTFPEFCVEDGIIFNTKDNFIKYIEALNARKDFEECLLIKKPETRILSLYEIGKKSYEVLNALVDDQSNIYPPHFFQFTAKYVYSKILWWCCNKVFNKKHGKTLEVKQWIEYLIKSFPESQKLGLWYHKLLSLHINHLEDVNYEFIGQTLIELFRDKTKFLSDTSKLLLTDLADKIKNSKKYKIDRLTQNGLEENLPSSNDNNNEDIAIKEIDSRCRRTQNKGRKRNYICTYGDSETTVETVEMVALNYYAINGYPGGVHCEGALIKSLLMLYFWDIIYNPKKIIPGSFISKYQTAPLDMFTNYFYNNRKELIDERLEEIGNVWSIEEYTDFAINNYEMHSHKLCAFQKINNIIKNAQSLRIYLTVIDRTILAKIFERMIMNLNEFKSGMPDLFLWNEDEKLFKFVEVKGENDKLAKNQQLWLNYLEKIGAPVEICWVHSVGSKRRKIIHKEAKINNELSQVY